MTCPSEMREDATIALNYDDDENTVANEGL